MKVEESILTTPEPLPDKARRLGPSLLSDDELLAVLIGAASNPNLSLDQARRLTSAGLLELACQDAVALARAGLSDHQSARILAAFELAKRMTRERRRPRPRCATPEEVVRVFGSDLATLDHERLFVLPLDPHSRLIGEPRLVSVGDVDGTEAGPRGFLRAALTAGAASCLALHNHPSGDVTPSAADRAVTQRLVAAGRAVDIPLVDHVIVGDGGRFTSLRRSEPLLFR